MKIFLTSAIIVKRFSEGDVFMLAGRSHDGETDGSDVQPGDEAGSGAGQTASGVSSVHHHFRLLDCGH